MDSDDGVDVMLLD